MPKDLNINVSLTQTEEFKQLCDLVQDMSRTLSFYAEGGRDNGRKAQTQLEIYDKVINDLIDEGIVSVSHQPPARGKDLI